MNVHRHHLVPSQELSRLNTAFRVKILDENFAEYQRELDDRVAACFLFIDRYLQSRIDDAPSHVSARSSRQSDQFRASQTPSQAGRVRLARNRWEVAELQLEALVAVQVLETRRLQDQEVDATTIKAKRHGVEPGRDADDEEDRIIDEARTINYKKGDKGCPSEFQSPLSWCDSDPSSENETAEWLFVAARPIQHRTESPEPQQVHRSFASFAAVVREP